MDMKSTGEVKKERGQTLDNGPQTDSNQRRCASTDTLLTMSFVDVQGDASLF